MDTTIIILGVFAVIVFIFMILPSKKSKDKEQVNELQGKPKSKRNKLKKDYVFLFDNLLPLNNQTNAIPKIVASFEVEINRNEEYSNKLEIMSTSKDYLKEQINKFKKVNEDFLYKWAKEIEISLNKKFTDGTKVLTINFSVLNPSKNLQSNENEVFDDILNVNEYDFKVKLQYSYKNLSKEYIVRLINIQFKQIVSNMILQEEEISVNTITYVFQKVFKDEPFTINSINISFSKREIKDLEDFDPEAKPVNLYELKFNQMIAMLKETDVKNISAVAQTIREDIMLSNETNMVKMVYIDQLERAIEKITKQ